MTKSTVLVSHASLAHGTVRVSHCSCVRFHCKCRCVCFVLTDWLIHILGYPGISIWKYSNVCVCVRDSQADRGEATTTKKLVRSGSWHDWWGTNGPPQLRFPVERQVRHKCTVTNRRLDLGAVIQIWKILTKWTGLVVWMYYLITVGSGGSLTRQVQVILNYTIGENVRMRV